MRYAAPPIGDLRFSAPRDPLHYNTTQDATAHGKICLEKGNPPSNTTDEDCLFLEVFAPSNATAESNLPVFFFIQVWHLVKHFNDALLTCAREVALINSVMPT